MRSGKGANALRRRAALKRHLPHSQEAKLWDRVVAFPIENQTEQQLELASLYRVAKKNKGAFALSSFEEPFGLGPREAASVGLPAARTRNGGLPTSFVDAEGEERWGAVFDPRSPEDTARALKQVLAPENWEAYSRDGRQHIHDTLSWEASAKRLMGLASRAILQRENGEFPRHPRLAVPPYFYAPLPEHALPSAYLESRFGWTATDAAE